MLKAVHDGSHPSARMPAARDTAVSDGGEAEGQLPFLVAGAGDEDEEGRAGRTMRMDEVRLSAMAKTAEEIWSEVEALPPSERRKLKARFDAAEAEEAEALPDYEEPTTEEEMDRELARSIEQGRAGHSSPAEEVLARLAARRAAGT